MYFSVRKKSISIFNFTPTIHGRYWIVLPANFSVKKSHIRPPYKTNIQALHATVITPGIENAIEIE
jgi:hypothetical protein